MSLPELERLCTHVFSAGDPGERTLAETQLRSRYFPLFSAADEPGSSGTAAATTPTNAPCTPGDAVAQCQFLLRESVHPYLQTYVLGYLRMVAVQHVTIFTKEQKLELRRFCLDFLFRNPSVAPFILKQALHLYSVLVKLSWYDLEQTLMEDMANFAKASETHEIISYRILGELVLEMNIVSPYRSAGRHRATAISFRDSVLLKIFELALNALKSKYQNCTSPGADACKEAILTLILNCLYFDFIGTASEDNAEDSGIIQIPTTWRSIFERADTVPLFFSFYASSSTNPELSKKVMECLVQIASIRRSMFSTDQDRHRFLSSLMDEIAKVIMGNIGMQSPENFHEICRFLARLKFTYQLSEIMERQEYSRWIEIVAGFSIKGFQSWDWSPNSMQYLVMFWAKMTVSSSRQAWKGSESHEKLAKLCSDVAMGFIQSRMQAVELQNSLEDPLEDQDALIIILDYLASFSRCQYEQICGFLCKYFDEALKAFQESITTHTVSTKQNIIVEQKLTWLALISGSFVGSRPTYSSTDEEDGMDGELIYRVIHVMTMHQSKLQLGKMESTSEGLESAIIYFLHQFRKSYVADQSSSQPATRILYTKLGQTLQMHELNDVLDVLVQKIGTNLKIWGQSEQITLKTLKLFSDLASGYSSAKNLRKRASAQYIMSNHSATTFPFLDFKHNFKIRGDYYASLGRLLFADESGPIEAEFEQFMAPFTSKFDQLLSADELTFKHENVKLSIIGTFRDLRGFIQSFITKKNFVHFFEWFFPKYITIITKSLLAWPDDIELSVSVLKFVDEFVTNRSGRLNFDISSANGILVFRLVSEIIQIAGNQIFERNALQEKSQSKLLTLCFSILRNALKGGYVAFGVFQLYSDPALEKALAIIFRLMSRLSIPILMTTPKLCRVYFDLLSVILSDHLINMETFDVKLFEFMLETISEGFKSSDSGVIHDACNSADTLGSFIVTKLLSSKRSNSFVVQYYQNHASSFGNILVNLFNALLYDSENQWTISRPFLPLYLLNRQYFTEYVESVVEQQVVERRQSFVKAVEALTDSLETNLTPKNRDRMTANVNNFKREISSQSIVVMLHRDTSWSTLQGLNSISLNERKTQSLSKIYP